MLTVDKCTFNKIILNFQGLLFYKKLSRRSNDTILIVDQHTLTIVGSAPVRVPPPPLPDNRSQQSGLLFSDGEAVFAICSSSKDDSLVVKLIHSGTPPTTNVPDLPLKLSRKHFRTLGYVAFEEELLNSNQIQTVCAIILYESCNQYTYTNVIL